MVRLPVQPQLSRPTPPFRVTLEIYTLHHDSIFRLPLSCVDFRLSLLVILPRLGHCLGMDFESWRPFCGQYGQRQQAPSRAVGIGRCHLEVLPWSTYSCLHLDLHPPAAHFTFPPRHTRKSIIAVIIKHLHDPNFTPLTTLPDHSFTPCTQNPDFEHFESMRT